MSGLPAAPQSADSRFCAVSKVAWYAIELTSEVAKSTPKQVRDAAWVSGDAGKVHPTGCWLTGRIDPSPSTMVVVGSITLVDPVGCRTTTPPELASVTWTSNGLRFVNEWRPAIHA